MQCNVSRSDNDPTTFAGSATTIPPSPASPIPLLVGHDFGSRYRITRFLGAGGMGAVYQAWDKALDVPVAIKVIRPEVSANPDDAAALQQRFKRELLLARQVTHPNVVRIHDFGEIGGVTYITMPYVEGADLRTLLAREGHLPLERVLRIARQVAAGLAAAHTAGVIHRDLKPANVMIAADDEALIMDFGSARSGGISGMGLTGAGAIVGTVAYMAPEQIQSAAVDHRADVYAFGLIVRDMLVPREKHGGAIAELMKRATAPPPPVRSIDPTIPEWLDALITRSLLPDADARWQSMNNIIAILDLADEGGPLEPAVATARNVATATQRKTGRMRTAFIAMALVAVFTASAVMVRARFLGVEVAPAPAVAVLPFRNASGDPSLDTLGPTLSAALASMLGYSSKLRTVTPERLNEVLRDLQISSNATLRPEEVLRVADHTNARKILFGQVTRYGDRIRIDSTLQDLDGNEPVLLYPVAAPEAVLLGSLAELAKRVQTHLSGGSSGILDQLRVTGWRPSTNSLHALRLYTEGIGLRQQGANRNALERFDAAIAADSNFALALSASAEMSAAVSSFDQAAETSRRALKLSESLPAQEKYRVAAVHYRIVNDPDREIEALKGTLAVSPGDTLVRFRLGSLYESRAAFDDAREELDAIVQADPKSVEALLALGRIAIRRGAPQESLPYLEHARSAAIELTHRSTENILQALGIAYKQMDRLDDALRHYEEALEMRRLLGQDVGMAATLHEIGLIQSRLGNVEAALRSYDEALRIRRHFGDPRGAGVVLINAGALHHQRGESDLALKTFHEALQIQREVGNQALEAFCLNSIGAIYFDRRQYVEASSSFEQALALREKMNQSREIADTLHNLGEVAARMAAFDVALAYYRRAADVRRRDDERASVLESSAAAAVLESQGRFGEAVSATRDAYSTFRRFNDRRERYVAVAIGYGVALSRGGQLAAARPILKVALTLAHDMKNTELFVECLSAEGERLLLRGDVSAARTMFEAALRQTANVPTNDVTLRLRVNLAKTAAFSGASQSGTATLTTLAADADAAGLKDAALEATLLLSQTLIQLQQYQEARVVLERALEDIERMGLRVLEPQARVLLARTYGALAMSAEARQQHTAALGVLERLRNEPGNNRLLERRDLASIYDESRREAAEDRRY